MENSLEKDFVPYQESMELKELDFDEPCILLYRGLDTQPVCQMSYEFKTEKNSDYDDPTNYWITVPTFSQAFRWFREKYKWNHSITTKRFPNIDYGYILGSMEGESNVWCISGFNSYEEAELACLRKLIEIVKK